MVEPNVVVGNVLLVKARNKGGAADKADRGVADPGHAGMNRAHGLGDDAGGVSCEVE